MKLVLTKGVDKMDTEGVAGVSKADNSTSDASVYLGKFTKNRTIMVGMQNTISKIPRAPYP